MTFGGAIRSGFSNYATFSGRAARSEFWWWMVFVMLASFLLSFVENFAVAFAFTLENGFGPAEQSTILSSIFSLLVLVPNLAVTTRRLHDINRSGWWQLLYVLPYLVASVAIAAMALGSVFGDGPGGFVFLFAAAGLMIVPLMIQMIVWLASRGTQGPNRFGPDPLVPASDDGRGLTRSSVPSVSRA